MCGRFASAFRPSDAWLELMQEWSEELFNRYNVSPGSHIGAYVEGQCHAMRWGLVPGWSKAVENRYATFNARLESADNKPAFRTAWRKQNKCLIPALGYYEWQKQGEVKQPYFVRSQRDEPLVFAGLWDEAVIDDNKLTSCTILTTDSVGQLESLHHRMPVMLEPDSAKYWLEASLDSASEKAYLQQYNSVARQQNSATHLTVYAVDRRVNRSSEESASLIDPLADK